MAPVEAALLNLMPVNLVPEDLVPVGQLPSHVNLTSTHSASRGRHGCSEDLMLLVVLPLVQPPIHVSITFVTYAAHS